MDRKGIIISLIFLFFSVFGLSAQPRAVGGRIGMTGLDASYQHSVGKRNFIQTDLSLDFGYAGSSAPGIKGTAAYNFVFATPAWTDKGSWALYAGPGLSLGYVEDRVTYRHGDYRSHYNAYGFMLSFVVNAGLEYTFGFPLQISADLRPYFGMHASNDITRKVDKSTEVILEEGKTAYYNNGWFGFIPTLSIRYRF